MTSLNEWDATYLAGKQIMRWPSSELVSLVHRNYKFLRTPNSQEILKVLELGFGTGPNISFIKSLGADFYGIELSRVAAEFAKESFPEMDSNLIIGSFEDLDQFPKELDLIYDRASVTHASAAEIGSTLRSSIRHLKKGGLYIGIEWFSSNHSDFNSPSNHIDMNTRSDFMTGQFAGIGQVHFADRDEMLNIFKDFEILELTEKIVTNQYPDRNSHQFASWNIVARKPI